MSRSALPLATALVLASLAVPAAAASTPSSAPAARAVTAPTAPEPGYDDLGIRRGTTWYLRSSIAAATRTTPYTEGPAGSYPMAGDFDGDGNDSTVLFRDGVWQVSEGPAGPTQTVTLGSRGDRPVVGDWDGDGKDEIGVFRNGLWTLQTTAGLRSFVFGQAGDFPIVGDWDGDGISGIGIRRGTGFQLRQTPYAGLPDGSFAYGQAGDRPVSGDWDHDGLDDIGLFRNGVWLLRLSNGSTQTVPYGSTGDLPVVRTVRTLAPGLEHRVLQTGDTRVQLASLALSQVATPLPVLANDRIQGVERTSSMAQRTGAILGINGDFAGQGGRPIHGFATAAELVQHPLDGGGSALGLAGGGRAWAAARPTVSVTLTPQGGSPRVVQRWNRSGPLADEVSAYTYASRGAEVVPSGLCYAVLTYADRPYGGPGGAVRRTLSVAAVRCGGAAPGVPRTAVLLAANSFDTGGIFLSGLQVGQRLLMDQVLGFAGATALLGGSEPLLADGQVLSTYVDRTGDYAQGRLPRTAVGITADGRLLLAVVDGRQPGWSTGMTLRQTAELMQGLGAVSAINLDGGGSTTMVLSGVIINRPSDGVERGVSSALVLKAPQPVVTTPSPAAAVRTSSAWARAARDPGSTGGLAEDQERAGAVLGPDLRAALRVRQGS